MSIVEEMVDANPSALIDLYELDITDLPNFSPFNYEEYYDIVPANSLYISTNWSVVSDVFYSPRLEDLSDWTLLITSGKDWNDINSDVNNYLGILDYSPPATVGDYFIDRSSGISYLMSDYTYGSYINLNNYTFENYGDFSTQDGTYTTGDTEYPNGIILTGNKWVGTPFPYTITADTVIELKYDSSEIGTIHAIGLEGSLVGNIVSYMENYSIQHPETPDDADTNFYAVNATAICYSSDGRNLFVARHHTGKIFAYYSAIPYALYDLYYYPGGYELDISPQDEKAPGMTLVDSDTKLFMSGANTRKIYRYDLTLAGDIRTASYSGNSFEILAGDLGITAGFDLQGMHINEAGTQLYIVTNGYLHEEKVFQYTLSTPYDLTTATFTGKGTDTHVSEAQDVYVTADGLRMFQVSYTVGWIWQFDLATAWDITTATLTGTAWDTADNYSTESLYYTTSIFEDRMTSLTFSTDGNSLFTVGNRSDKVHKYGLMLPFTTNAEQEVSPGSNIIQVSGYDNYGIGYKIFDDDSIGPVSAIIPVGQFYTGNANYLLFGITTGDTSLTEAQSVFYDINIYDKVSAQFEEITRTTKVTFPASVLFTAMQDKVIIFDTTESNRQMWKVILNTELSATPPKIQVIDSSSGTLYIGTDEGIYEYDFISDTITLAVSSTEIIDLKTAMTLEGAINTDRLNQPIPVLAYIDNGELKVRKHIDGAYITYSTAVGVPTNFERVEISASRELYAFTNTDKAYFFNLLENISDDFNFVDAYDSPNNGQRDVTLNGTISVEFPNILISTKEKLQAKIASTYNTGYYSPETYLLSAAFDNTEFGEGIQVVKNPNFSEGTKYYIYGYGWEYSNHSMVATNTYSSFYQKVTIPSIEEYVVTVHVSDIQTGSLSIVLEPIIKVTNTDDDVIIQYILDGSDDYIKSTDTRYIKRIQENVFEERDISEEGVFSFIIPTRSFEVSIIILGNNFTGTVNSVKMQKLNEVKAINRISATNTVDVYGPMEVSNITENSDMVQYIGGIFCPKITSEEVFIYYWEFDGISWKFTYHEGYSSNRYEDIYYIDCTLPKALIRLSGEKYTDSQLALIRVNELRLFSSDSNVLLEKEDEYGNEYLGVSSVSFDDRTSYYYTQMRYSTDIQKFKDLVCVEKIEVYNQSTWLNAYNNQLTLNNYNSYDISYWGDETASNTGTAGIYRFYNGTNQFENPIIWKGKAYQPWPIKVEGYELSGDSEIPRPTLTAANIGFVISDLIHEYDDLLGAKVTRKRTFAKYLDEVNFINGNIYADSTIEFPDTVFYVNKKISETYEIVSFELASQWDLEGIKLPRRLVTYDTCRWQYKDGSCGYSGTNYFDIHGNPVNYESEDVCGKHLDDCLKRFTDKVETGDATVAYKISTIPFGGFPGVGM